MNDDFLASRHSEAWHSRAIGAKAQSFVASFYTKILIHTPIQQRPATQDF
jgi:hypothetical protein